MKLIRLPVVPYGQALALQLQLRERLQTRTGHDGESVGYLLVLQHPPVITLGKRGTVSALSAPGWVREQGIEVYKIDRGGEATYHGPGQMVVYPIVRLDELGMGVADLVRGLASCIGAVLEKNGVSAAYDPEIPGLWTQGEALSRKIASVGMRVSGGVTTHGAAVNLVNDMTAFQMFTPCGMPGAPMARLLDYRAADEDAGALYESFENDFIAQFETFTARALEPLQVELPGEEAWVAAESLDALIF